MIGLWFKNICRRDAVASFRRQICFSVRGLSFSVPVGPGFVVARVVCADGRCLEQYGAAIGCQVAFCDAVQFDVSVICESGEHQISAVVCVVGAHANGQDLAGADDFSVVFWAVL